MWCGIWYFSLRVLKCFSLMVDLKSFTVHNRRMMNSLRPFGPMTDWTEGSTLAKFSLKPFSDPSMSKPSSLVEGEEANGFLLSLEVPGLP